MQISTSLLYSQAQRQMNTLTDQENTLQTQISTGKRLQSASDDVVAYQKLATIKCAGSDATAYSSNVDAAQSLISQSDTTLTSVTTQITRAQELATQANSGTVSDTDKAAIATELRSISDSLKSLANTKASNGQALFGDTTGAAAVTTAADGSVSFASGAQATIPVDAGVSVTPTTSAKKVFGSVPTSNGGTTDVFSVLDTLAGALESGGDVTDAASKAVTDLQSAGDQVSNAQAALGATGTRLNLLQTQQTNQATNRESDRTALEDTDETTAITELQKTMTVLQATQASFAKLSSLSLFDYLK